MNILANIMNVRRVIPIYECKDSFLYEIMEDYKDAKTQGEKDEIFHSFCSSVWSSGNKRRIHKKSIRFKIRKDLLYTELGQVFAPWSDIGYTYYKSMTTDENWYCVIRQKINNIYTKYFDKEVITGKEYMDLLKTPKRLYYQWISGTDMDAGTVTKVIADAMDNAGKIKMRLQTEKMDLPWNEYKKVIEVILKRCFENCKLLGEYEDKANIHTKLDFLTEDHFYAGYICRYLDREILPFQKKYYGVRQHKKYSRCKQCGALMEKTGNKRLYCNKCAREKELERYQRYNKKRNHK